MVLGENLLLVGVGLAIGVGLTLMASRAITAQLYCVTGNDPLTVAAITALLGFVAGVATYLPARRAAGVDPATALRIE